MSGAPAPGGHALGTWLRLAGLAIAGLCAVSIPVTLAVVLSATHTSDVLRIGGLPSTGRHATAQAAIERLRCTPRRGWYALTFDDGPSPATTPRLVAALRRAHAVATFFDLGVRAAARLDLVEAQRRVGVVANHTYSHPHLPRVSSARRIQELQATAKVLDYPNALVRPPYGQTDAATDRDIRRSGLTPVYWTLDVHDTHGATREAIVRRALTAGAGDVVLLHEGVGATVGAVPAIVAGLRRRGLCPGLLGPTRRTVVAATGVPFHVTAVQP